MCRWGILGTALIARKNWQAIWNAGNGVLVAVASRSSERAEQFIRECQACVPFQTPPRACGYEELLASPDIDALYIPLPTGIRKEWVIRAARAGKHVLCEKPCADTAADLAEMLLACRENHVQFMDGVMFMHSQRLERIRETLHDGASVGTMKRIASQFSFLAGDEFLRSNIRMSDQLESLGCLGDLGWYNIRFAQVAMQGQPPERVSGRCLTSSKPNGQGVPLEFSGELFYPGGVSASFYCSFVTHNQQWANVSGTRGYLYVPDFVLSYYGSEASFQVSQSALDQRGCQFNMNEYTRRIAVPEYSNNAPGSQEANLFQRFGQLVLSGQTDSSWGELSLQTQQIIDACLRSARQEGQVVKFAP